jgi:hypothetical protein
MMINLLFFIFVISVFPYNLVRSARWDEKISLQAIFDDLKEIFPKNDALGMKKILDIHTDMLHIIDSKRYSSPAGYYRYRYSRGRYVRNFYDQGTVDESPSTTTLENSIEGLNAINLDIHIDIAMIGFPASTVEFIRDSWFDNLGRKEPIMYTTGSHEHIFTYQDADVTISYHFHMIQISFTVADAIRDRFHAMSASNINSSNMVIHTWEMEEALESLSDKISSIHGKSSAASEANDTVITLKPSATIFILNIPNLLPSGYTYRYCSDFTTEEISALKQNKKIVDLAKSILNDELRQTRIEKLPDSSAKTSNQRSHAIIEDFKRVLASQDIPPTSPIVNISSSGLHWRDAVKETKEWSKAYADETSTMIVDPEAHFSLDSRAMKVLSSKTTSWMNRRKSQLIDALLSKEIITVNEEVICSASTWIGSSRVIWMDIMSMAADTNSKEGTTSEAASLTSSEWLLLGHSTNQDNVNKEILFLEGMIQRHLDSSIESYRRSDCSAETFQEVFHQDATSFTNRAEFVSSAMYQFVSPRYSYYSTVAMTGICAHFLGDILYFNATIESSIDMRRLYDSYLNPATGEASSSISLTSSQQNVLQESARFHRRILAEAYRLIYHSESMENRYLEKSSEEPSAAASVMMSNKALNYLAHLSGKLLSLTRSFLSPPMILVSNPISPIKAEEDAWTRTLPDPFISPKVDVTVYLISLKDLSGKEKKFSKSQFEYETFFRELQRLRLPSQQMTLTLQPIDISQELELASALAMCKTHTHINTDTDDPNLSTYVNGKCILTYIHKQDDDQADRSKTPSSNSEAKKPNAMPSSSGGPNKRSQSAYSSAAKQAPQSGLKVHHIPVFVLLVDEVNPVYLEHGDCAGRVGNSVIIIQNLNSPSNLPINKALLSVAEVIGGLPSAALAHHELLPSSISLAEALEVDHIRSVYGYDTLKNESTIQVVMPMDQIIGHGSSPRFSNSLGGDMTPIFSDLDMVS